TMVGRSSTEKVSAAPGSVSHDRPRRPRPAVCRSATSTVPSPAPSLAAAMRSAFVDPVSVTTRTGDHSLLPASTLSRTESGSRPPVISPPFRARGRRAADSPSPVPLLRHIWPNLSGMASDPLPTEATPPDLHTTAGKLADLEQRRYEAVHAGAAR